MSERPVPSAIHLEDDPRDVELIRHHLSRSDLEVELDAVESVSELERALATGRYDSVLLDFNIPGEDAFAVISKVQDADPDMPIIVVTGSVGEEAVVDCMRAGVSDLVHKDRLARLTPALRRAFRERAVRIERELTRTQLRETHETLHALVRSSPVAVCTVRSDQNVGVVWNEAAECLFGWTADEVLGEPLPFVPAAKRREADSLVDRVLGGQSVIGQEVERVRRDGTPLNIRVDAAPLRDAGGSIVGVVQFMSDITDEKRRRTQLESSQEELREIFDGSPVIQFALDLDGKLLELNRAFTRSWRLSPQHGMGGSSNAWRCPSGPGTPSGYSSRRP